MDHHRAPDLTPSGRPSHADWLAAAAVQPWRLDFYQALRRIEAAHPHLPRLGRALRPQDEPVRLSQPPELSFAPATVVSLRLPEGGAPLLMSQRVFGLLGPQGALPTHLTELVRDRLHHQGDRAIHGFMDLLAQRLGLLFYRAWAQAQPVLGRDRPDDDEWAVRLSALFGLAEEARQGPRDALGLSAKLAFAGRLSRQVRDADGLAHWARWQLGVPLQVLPWSGHWMRLGRSEQTRLIRHPAQGLGRGAVLGQQVWDVQHKFRIAIGPLDLAPFQSLLPGGPGLDQLLAMVRQWVGLEFEWDVQLILRRDQVPRLCLGGRGPDTPPQLGRSTWLGRYRRPAHADQVILNPERMPALVRRRRPAPASPSPSAAHPAAGTPRVSGESP